MIDNPGGYLYSISKKCNMSNFPFFLKKISYCFIFSWNRICSSNSNYFLNLLSGWLRVADHWGEDGEIASAQSHCYSERNTEIILSSQTGLPSKGSHCPSLPWNCPLCRYNSTTCLFPAFDHTLVMIVADLFIIWLSAIPISFRTKTMSHRN